jgi:hypothetical protein
MGPCAGGSSPAHSPHPRLPGIPSGGSLRGVLPKHSGGSVAGFHGLPFFPRQSTRAPERVCGSLNTTRAPCGQGRRFREARAPIQRSNSYRSRRRGPVARSPFSRFRSCADFPQTARAKRQPPLLNPGQPPLLNPGQLPLLNPELGAGQAEACLGSEIGSRLRKIELYTRLRRSASARSPMMRHFRLATISLFLLATARNGKDL